MNTPYDLTPSGMASEFVRLKVQGQRSELHKVTRGMLGQMDSIDFHGAVESIGNKKTAQMMREEGK